MTGFWQEELTEEQTEELIRNAAQRIVQKGLSAPAVFMLEAHKPLAYVASHAALAVSPLLVGLFGFDKVDQYTQLFRSRENIERLIQRIEILEEETRQAKGSRSDKQKTDKPPAESESE